MVRKTIVGAHYGLRDWMAQRITAAVMALFTIIMAAALLRGAAADYQTWAGFMSGGAIRFAAFIFIVSVCWHAWVGVRDIWMDYVKHTGVRLFLHVATLLALIGEAGWAAQVLWRI